jgi:hypothetical protein
MEPPPPDPNGVGGGDDDAHRAPPPNDDIDDMEDIDDSTDDEEEDEDEELCTAIRKKHLGTIRSVVERRLPQQPVRTSNPLRAAIGCGAPREIVQYVYGCYPDAVREIGGYDQSLPMHHVNRFTPPESVRFLIDRYPEALGVRNVRGELPLYRALDQNAGRAVIQILVERRPDSIEEFDPEDRREGPRVLPLHVAAATWINNPIDVMRYLVELPNGPESVSVRTPPDWGNDEFTRDCLPLHLVLQRSLHPENTQFLLEQWREAARERLGPFLPLHLALDAHEPPVEVVRSVLVA